MADISVGSRSGSRRSKAKVDNPSKPSDNLQYREAEYQRMNQELEAKTANLVREAEEMLKRDFDDVNRSSTLLDKVMVDDSLSFGDEDLGGQDWETKEPVSVRSTKSGRTTNWSDGNERRPPSATSGKTSSRPPSNRKTIRHVRKGTTADDVALAPEAVLAMQDFSLQKTISSIEGRIDRGEMESHVALDMADVIPHSANEMGSEAQIRFLKAKLRVMQEELTRVTRESYLKENEKLSMRSAMGQLEESNAQHSKTIKALKTQLEKYERLSGTSRNKTLDLETELAQMKKEMNTISQTHQKATSTKGLVEVRLNRAVEELDRYKREIATYKSAMQDASSFGQKKADHLQAENKRLENQKKELMVAFKKQMKLIDLYKRQKLHIEAAKMLSFAEDEFLSALEWGK